MLNLVLTGLEGRVETDLGRLLLEEGHDVTISDCNDLPDADVVFCNGDSDGYPLLIRRLHALRPNLPVVVVTRLPESDKWLNALELGAADYCSAPFEPIQVRWILSAVVGRGALTAAA